MDKNKRNEDQKPQTQAAEPAPEPTAEQPSMRARIVRKALLRIKSGLRSGDVYMNFPKGSNN